MTQLERDLTVLVALWLAYMGAIAATTWSLVQVLAWLARRLRRVCLRCGRVLDDSHCYNCDEL